MYVRSNVYPNGQPIPDSLPPSYQPASLGNAPKGQVCFNCKNFQIASRYCNKWDANVKPRWWCEAWEKGPVEIAMAKKPRIQEVKPYKRIATSIVEEHFSAQPKPKNSWEDWTVNEEDTIRVDVPLMIRLLEYAREDAKSDVDLHIVAEKLIELSVNGDVLDMDDYEDIVPDSED